MEKQILIRCCSSELSFWDVRFEFTDITITCNQGSFGIKAHRVILAAASSFFRKKLQQAGSTISLDISEEDLQNILVLIYKGEVIIPSERLQSFIKIVNMYSIKIISPTPNKDEVIKRKNKVQGPLCKRMRKSLPNFHFKNGTENGTKSTVFNEDEIVSKFSKIDDDIEMLFESLTSSKPKSLDHNDTNNNISKITIGHDSLIGIHNTNNSESPSVSKSSGELPTSSNSSRYSIGSIAKILDTSSQLCGNCKGNTANTINPVKQTATTQDKKSLDDLPAEILIKILSHLSTYDLLRRVALVSKHFYSITKCPGAHLYVTISKNSNEESSAEFIQNAILMQELSIVEPDFGIWNQKQLDEDVVVENANRFSDKMLLATNNHQYLKVIKSQLEVTSSCVTQLTKFKWWGNLTSLSLNIDQYEKYNVILECQKQLESALSGTQVAPQSEIYYVSEPSAFKYLPEMKLSVTELHIFSSSLQRAQNYYRKALQPNSLSGVVTIKIESEEACIEELIILLANACPNVMTMDVKTSHQTSQAPFREIITKCLNLKVLQYQSEDFVVAEELLPNIWTNLSQLKLLELNTCKLAKESGRKLVQNCKQLQAVLNSDCLFVNGDYSMESVARLFSNFSGESKICDKILVY